jgi:hypothetical protein
MPKWRYFHKEKFSPNPFYPLSLSADAGHLLERSGCYRDGQQCCCQPADFGCCNHRSPTSTPLPTNTVPTDAVQIETPTAEQPPAFEFKTPTAMPRSDTLSSLSDDTAQAYMTLEIASSTKGWEDFFAAEIPTATS